VTLKTCTPYCSTLAINKSDPKPCDNRILECAVFGKADLIVTRDKEILRLKEYMGVKIASLGDYYVLWGLGHQLGSPFYLAELEIER